MRRIALIFRVMNTERHDPIYYLAKAAEYRMKVAAATEVSLRRALAAVALEYIEKARERIREAEAKTKH